MNTKRKTELDTIGRELFERSSLESETAERIAASPDAYHSVVARIGSIGPQKAVLTNWFGLGRTAVAATALIVVSFVSLAVIFREGDEPARVNVINVPAKPPVQSRPDTPPRVNESEQSTGRVNYPDTVVAIVSTKKPQPPRRPAFRESVPKAEFVSLGLSSSPQQTADGGRVIRVELPAASLFAMGVNVPIENSSQIFRADLIVGPDGVTRAVKLVE